MRFKEARDLVVEPGSGACARRDDRGVVVEDELLGHPTQAGQTADQARAQVADRPGQAERDRVGGRERQGRDQPEGLPADAPPDRHPDAGVPPVDLADLARLVRRPLERPAGQERGTNADEVVLEDRDPAAVSVHPETLTDDRRADRRVSREHHRDALGERVELRARRATHIARRLGQAEQSLDRVPAHLQLAGDRRFGATLPMKEPMDLGPVLHLMHSFLPRTRVRRARGCQST